MIRTRGPHWTSVYCIILCPLYSVCSLGLLGDVVVVAAEGDGRYSGGDVFYGYKTPRWAANSGMMRIRTGSSSRNDSTDGRFTQFIPSEN